jgi:hypothetical protein
MELDVLDAHAVRPRAPAGRRRARPAEVVSPKNNMLIGLM